MLLQNLTLALPFLLFVLKIPAENNKSQEQCCTPNTDEKWQKHEQTVLAELLTGCPLGPAGPFYGGKTGNTE